MNAVLVPAAYVQMAPGYGVFVGGDNTVEYWQ